ncbi:universal stress protein family, putative [Synechococcus sp. PCC 7335]|uniref:universal stress protein n=1 Tax=Synechococcus sp. (strain ATCC 29403 / PCC 7335) TaxID=91464 RepID=UPI00017EE0FB|nr:universal stress protein [Synechococcus sp. PCC 7335]EDX83140.1 universal stress protein family, putative [Synechococcus sp. PCC 7335]
MYNRILVALDTLEPAVFETAVDIAAVTEATLLLLHVLSEQDLASPPSPSAIAREYATPICEQSQATYQAQWRSYVDQSLETLRDYVSRAEAAGVIADFLQTRNAPGQGICQTAKSWQADLIVMGSHHRQGIEEIVLGSVSNYVMHHAPCSVMIIALDSEQNEPAAAVAASHVAV